MNIKEVEVLYGEEESIESQIEKRKMMNNIKGEQFKNKILMWQKNNPDLMDDVSKYKENKGNIGADVIIPLMEAEKDKNKSTNKDISKEESLGAKNNIEGFLANRGGDGEDLVFGSDLKNEELLADLGTSTEEDKKFLIKKNKRVSKSSVPEVE